jgi:hypothetical protein
MGVENGRFFIFSRSGRGRDTIYTVQEYKQKTEVVGPNGQKIIADLPFPHSLNETIIAKLATDAFELDTVYPSVTPEQEYRIVHEGAKAVDDILGGSTKTQSNPASTAQAATNQATTQAVVATQTITNVVAVEALKALQQQQQQQQQLQAQELQDATASTKKSSEAPITSVPNLAAMSEEEFFKMVEKGGF